jgi:hypothetical protein
MRKLLLAAAVALTLAGAATASRGHVKVPLEPVGGSGVTGHVTLHQLRHGGTDIHVVARGLEPGQTYTSFYYDGADCENGPDEVGTFTANRHGHGKTKGEADDDLDEIGSVSVRSPDYSILYACANVR